MLSHIRCDHRFAFCDPVDLLDDIRTGQRCLEEVAPAIEKALRLKKPVLIDCLIPEDDKVFPMVPA